MTPHRKSPYPHIKRSVIISQRKVARKLPFLPEPRPFERDFLLAATRGPPCHFLQPVSEPAIRLVAPLLSACCEPLDERKSAGSRIQLRPGTRCASLLLIDFSPIRKIVQPSDGKTPDCQHGRNRTHRLSIGNYPLSQPEFVKPITQRFRPITQRVSLDKAIMRGSRTSFRGEARGADSA